MWDLKRKTDIHGRRGKNEKNIRNKKRSR